MKSSRCGAWTPTEPINGFTDDCCAGFFVDQSSYVGGARDVRYVGFVEGLRNKEGTDAVKFLQLHHLEHLFKTVLSLDC